MSEKRDLSRLFESLRESESQEEEAPPFGKVWLAARERQAARTAARPRRRLFQTAAALSAAVVLVVVLVSAPGSRGPAPPSEEGELARSLSEWQAPLDFLLENPGGEPFGPAIQWPAVELPAELPTLAVEEIL